MSKSDIWMPLYIGDYLADTMLLDATEHGAYLLLIMAYWRNGGPISSNKKNIILITKMTPNQYRKVSPTLLNFFVEKGGFLHHKRLDSEIERATAKQAAAREKASNAANARWSKSDTPSNAPSNAPSTSECDASSNASSNASYSHSHPTNNLSGKKISLGIDNTKWGGVQ